MRICHLSDLHFGKHDADLAGGLAAELHAQSPDLVIVSGDFTQIGTEAEFQAASAFLTSLKIPIFTVPGTTVGSGTSSMRKSPRPVSPRP